jgi:hypothetical protein
MSSTVEHIGSGIAVRGGVAELSPPPAGMCLDLTNLLHGARVRVQATQLPKMPNFWRSGHKRNGAAILARLLMDVAPCSTPRTRPP